MIKGLHEKGIFTESYPFRLALNTEVDFEFPLHWHPAVELVYILENKYELIVNNTRFPLNEKDILLIPGGEIHGIPPCKTQGIRAFIQFDISKLDSFGNINTIRPFLSAVKKITPQEHPILHKGLESQISEILSEYKNRDFAYAFALNARIFDLLVILSRHFVNSTAKYSLETSTHKSAALMRLEQAFKYIEENYMENISLKDVSRAVGFSEYYFSRIFKETTEKNFRDYLNELRIRKAEKLLAGATDSITQIAHAAGFNSMATFNRVFKEIKGCSPTLYRNICI